MQSQHPTPSYAPADMYSRINLTSHKLRIKIMKRRHAELSGGGGGLQICKMKMNPAEYTRHTGLATDTSERELAAWRPAEITQVSLSRLFSAFMTAKWQKKPRNKTTTWLLSRQTQASKQTLLSPIKLRRYSCWKAFNFYFPSTVSHFSINKVAKQTNKPKNKKLRKCGWTCQTRRPRLAALQNDGDNCVWWMIKMVSAYNLCLWYLLVASCWLESYPF